MEISFISDLCAVGISKNDCSVSYSQTSDLNPLTHKIKLSLQNLYGNLQTAWKHLKH